MKVIETYDLILRCSIPIIQSMRKTNTLLVRWIDTKARIHFNLLYHFPQVSLALQNKLGADLVIPSGNPVLAKICCIALYRIQSLYRSLNQQGFLSAKVSRALAGSSSSSPFRILASFADGKA